MTCVRDCNACNLVLQATTQFLAQHRSQHQQVIARTGLEVVLPKQMDPGGLRLLPGSLAPASNRDTNPFHRLHMLHNLQQPSPPRLHSLRALQLANQPSPVTAGIVHELVEGGRQCLPGTLLEITPAGTCSRSNLTLGTGVGRSAAATGLAVVA